MVIKEEEEQQQKWNSKFELEPVQNIGHKRRELGVRKFKLHAKLISKTLLAQEQLLE